MSLLNVEQQASKLLASHYPADLAESPNSAPEDVRSMDVLANALIGKDDWDWPI